VCNILRLLVWLSDIVTNHKQLSISVRIRFPDIGLLSNFHFSFICAQIYRTPILFHIAANDSNQLLQQFKCQPTQYMCNNYIDTFYWLIKTVFNWVNSWIFMYLTWIIKYNSIWVIFHDSTDLRISIILNMRIRWSALNSWILKSFSLS